MEHETFWTLLKDPAHWAFEIFLIALFNGLLGLIIWPRIKKFLQHYKSDDKIIHDWEKNMK
jgi:hypothetical protein